MSFTDEEVERYARHLVLREIGGPGQQRLKAARVLIVGAGGLGAPAALYLAAAGVGALGAGRSGHGRPLQPAAAGALRRAPTMGRPKVEAAADAAGRAEPPRRRRADRRAARPRPTPARWSRGYDLVLDGTDDFATRFAVNAACVAEGKPLVSGAIGRWTGQVGVFAGRPCYRCLVPEIPPDAETCAAVGVVGALAGVIGSMMALEAVKLIAGAGEPLDRPAADLRRPGGRDPHGADRRRSRMPGLRRAVTAAPSAACDG